MDFSIRKHFQFATPTKFLLLFVFLSQFIVTIYSTRQITPPISFELLNPLAFLWLIWWWLKEDSKLTRVKWPIDFGMFLYFAWMFLVPYHLFKTRGIKGLWGIFLFIGILIAAWISAAVIAVIIWY